MLTASDAVYLAEALRPGQMGFDDGKTRLRTLDTRKGRSWRTSMYMAVGLRYPNKRLWGKARLLHPYGRFQ